jgi:putative ABC transport system permease protein
LSSYRPVEVLKGRFKNSNQGVFFRKGMVVIQFITSITLIAGTYTVYRQLNFMRSQKLGVNIDQTLVINAPNVYTDSTYRQQFQAFKHRLTQYPEVATVCGSTSVPGAQPDWNAGGIRRLSQREEESNQYRVLLVDHDYIKLYGLEMLTGRGFNSEVVREDKNIILNESATRLMGFLKIEDAINDRVYFWGDTFRIVGVLKNFRQESLKKSFEPLIFRYGQAPEGYYSVRLNASNAQKSLARFETVWKEIFPGNPFSFFFLDEHYNQQYQADQQFGQVFGMFSGLAIFIACLGLFGLSSLTAIQRTKEIGVRKVLGASVSSVLALMSRDYFILMLIAIVFAWPFTWWIMNSWLADFASRISLSVWTFALPSLVIILIALLTVSIHTLKAARTNPSRSLRYE